MYRSSSSFEYRRNQKCNIREKKTNEKKEPFLKKESEENLDYRHPPSHTTLAANISAMSKQFVVNLLILLRGDYQRKTHQKDKL